MKHRISLVVTPCRSLTDDELETYMLGHASQDRAEVIERHLRSCESCQLRLHENWAFIDDLRMALMQESAEPAAAEPEELPVVTSHSERRVHSRTPCNVRITVRVEGRPGLAHELHGRLVDVSATGAGILLDERLPVETRARIQLAGGDAVLAMTRYCRSGDSDFHIGVELCPGYSWAA
jgi:hypothetical protein